jgi:hypothetical protein
MRSKVAGCNGHQQRRADVALLDQFARQLKIFARRFLRQQRDGESARIRIQRAQ